MAVAVVLMALFPALAPAQTSASVPVTGGSWYWQEQQGTVSPPAGTPLPPVAPPGALPTPDVPPGDFPVSVVGGQPDKESFLQLDTSAIAQGSTVQSLVLTLHEDPSAQGKLNATTATIEARAVTGYMAGGAQGAPWANRPAYDTSAAGASGKRAADGTWTFDLTTIAARWASGDLSNNGLALVPAAPQQSQSYEVVWFGPNGADAPTVAAAPSTGPARTLPRARTIESSHGAPPWGFYLAIVAIIALIGASTLSLGDLGEPELERQGGVLRTLERRSQEVST